HPDLEIESHGLTFWDLDREFVTGGLAGTTNAPLRDEEFNRAKSDLKAIEYTALVGALGFLGDGERMPANLGLLDLVESLRWVRTNIAAFGGDPDLVTVFGQSAGGDAAAHLMISEGTAGLFRRAIIQSAPLGLSRGRARMNAAMVRAVGNLHPD
ncbi:carboxylesterase family protein, partial [Bacillus sp. S34]|nr:carboxylesterase family protein [Bacillus sp. S34]